LQELLKEAAQAGFAVTTVDVEQGPEDGTAYSVLVSVSGGNGLGLFTKSWSATLLRNILNVVSHNAPAELRTAGAFARS
jgi:protein subunit release factor B